MEISNTPKTEEFIKSLQGKSYLEGLTLLVARTKAGKAAEGGISQPDLTDSNGITKMDNEGLFKVD